MPDMDGVEAARRIRALYPDGRTSGGGPAADRGLDRQRLRRGPRPAYLEAGLDDYLAKPFEKADLAALFARWRRPQAERDGRSGLGAA